jgi:uncharacterized protein YecE (DUF72 family)
MPMVIGTSGWQYKDWRGALYPAGVPQARWLEYYADAYPAVENNGTFYRLPGPGAFEAWRHRTPEGFTMVVKASRYLTHIRRLRDPAEPVARLLGAAIHLGGRLGPILLQLPPSLAADQGTLAACLEAFAQFRPPAGIPGLDAGAPGLPAGTPALPAGSGLQAGPVGHSAGIRVAVELRHESWWTGETRDTLTRHGAALCWADRQEQPVAPLWRTANWGYLRLHEGAGRSWPRYTARTLRGWLSAIAGTWEPGQDVFVFFNNDQHGAAPRDAAALAVLARDAGIEVRSPAGESPP